MAAARSIEVEIKGDASKLEKAFGRFRLHRVGWYVRTAVEVSIAVALWIGLFKGWGSL